MPGKGKGEFNMGFYKVHSATILGLKVEFVQVEADAGNGLPMFHMVGYLSSEVKEAAERVRTAMRNAGYTMPAKKIVINLSPACVRKKGSVFDLPIACTYDPMSKGGRSSDGRKVKGVIHWVSARHAVPAEVRLFDRLFVKEDMNDIEEGKTFEDYLNPDSLKTVTGYLEPSLNEAAEGDTFQFERLGYFCVDRDSTTARKVFNRTVTLKDSWAKMAAK